MRISVIIPTFNRCDVLREAIGAVRRQTLPADQYEIVVVDNASTDGTKELIQQLNGDGGKQIRYVYEGRPGLHWGRHAGANAAQGEILAFIDDDCLPEENWLLHLCKAYDEFRPDAAGGKILIRWDQPPPEWVIQYEGCLGKLDYGPAAMFLPAGHHINGGNFTILKQRLIELHGFDPDQIGDYLIGNGEGGLCERMQRTGGRILWVPDAMVWHCQTVARNGTLKDLRRRFYNNGIGRAYAYYRDKRFRTRELWRRAGRAALQTLRHKLGAWHKRHRSSADYYKAELLSAECYGEAKRYAQLALRPHLRRQIREQRWM